MLLTSIGYSEMNKADPDCGLRSHGRPGRSARRPAWPAAGLSSPLTSSSSPVLARSRASTCSCCSAPTASAPTRRATGTARRHHLDHPDDGHCYVGIEVSANFQKVLLSIELVMLAVLSVTALVKVGNGSAPPGHLTPSIDWLTHFTSLSLARSSRASSSSSSSTGAGTPPWRERGDQDHNRTPASRRSFPR